jgi:hypothetical protein
MRRHLAIPMVLLLLLALAAPAMAEVQAFDAKAFEAAQAAGQGVVVDVHATW